MINLDINKEMSGGKIVHGRVGDNSCTETVSVINNDGTPFDLSEFTITFMGNTYEYKTKVINTNGVRINDAKKGLFQFTFPNEAFSVAGSYERAYFQFTGKNNMVITTGDFEIIVFENTDLTATEAETVISEYNKLVSELQELQKKNIANLQEQQEEYMIELAQKYNEFQSDLDILATKIEEYETNVNKSALDAKDAINSSIEEAQSTLSEMLTKGLNDIHQALEEFKNGDFYTKLEADNLFVKKTDLTKENVNLGNVDNYATATQEEAEAGLATNKFMTPALVFKAIAKWVQGKFVSATEPQTILGNKDFTETPTVNGYKVVTFENIPVKSFWGSGTSLTNSILNSRLTFGNILGVDPLHQLKDVPFTLNSGMYEATMTRDANLFFDVNIRVQGGGASTDYSDYYYISLESGTQTGGSGETKTDFVMLGANNGQRLNLSNTLTGKAYVSLKKGQKFAITVTGLRGTQKIFSWQFLSGTIEEL